MTDLHPDIRALVGSTISGRYRVDGLVVADESGARFEAQQLDPARAVGLRVLAPGAKGSSPGAPFEAEAVAISSLDHPNCVRVTDSGTTASGLVYLVTDPVSGPTLADAAADAWEPLRALEVAIEVFAALDHAHGRGVAHGDLKPAAVFLTRDPEGRERVAVADFGLAKLRGPAAEVPAGTQAYGSTGAALSASEVGADVHAAATILHQLLAQGAPKLPSSVPPQLARALAKLLEAARGPRPPSPRAVIGELEALRARLGGASSEELATVAATATATSPSVTAADTTAPVAAPELAAGQVIAERFRLDALVGSGGMGVVWKATHLALQAPVAIKLLYPSQHDPEEARARFLREAQASAALRSSHIVQVLDYGVHEGMPYLVMELLEGRTLADRLAEAGALSFEATIEIMRDVCTAVARAHEGEVIHRDLKPANIFLVQDLDRERAKVLDFGIAKIVGRGPALELATTQTGAVLGTPYYMSPEQLQESKSVDHRSDLWSLGVITYQCLTGSRPFDSRSLAELCVSITTRDPVAPEELAALPRGVDAWMRKALARDPAQRFDSVQDMFSALRDIEAGHAPAPAAERLYDRAGPSEREFELRPNLGPDLVLEEPVEAPPTPSPAVVGYRSSPDVKRERSYWPLILLGVGLAVLVVAYVFMGRGSEPSSEAAPAPGESPEVAASDPKQGSEEDAPEVTGFGDPCEAADDCGWDDPCAPTRCVGIAQAPAGECEGQAARPAPGECVCVEQHCALRPSEPPPPSAGCAGALCGLDQAAGACVSGSMDEANEHREQGPACVCDEATRLCEFKWVEPIACKKATDCWVTNAAPYYPIERPRSMRGKDFRPCRDGEFAPTCREGRCALITYNCD
ncbi:protein kinase domain-containing protein [Enhygromyxa salina]|uniref:protein kinase domain-containing protein n=1 Tax=Enhygromyxa salina TaxID=215803 RepID=UPI0015E61DF9|nr:serine/threonine-protein kinase [Enhygromyxa salina]